MNTTLLGEENILHLNIGLNKLNNSNIKKFFTDPQLVNFVNDYYSIKSNQYSEDLFIKYQDLIIFLDPISLFYYYKKNKIKNFGEKIGVFYQQKIYITYQQDLGVFLNFFSQNIDHTLYHNIRLFYNSIGGTIYINQILKIKKIKRINSLLDCHNLESINQKNRLYEITNNIFSYPVIQYNQRYDKNLSDLRNKSLHSLEKNNIKIERGYFQPILSIYRYKENKFGKKIGFGYGSNYNISNRDFLFYYNEKNVSTGFDYTNNKLGKIKSFVEGIERYNSGFFDSDIKGKKILKYLNTDLIENIIGSKLSDIAKEREYYYNYIFKLTANGDDIKLEEGVATPYNMLYYPLNVSDNLFYYSNSSGIGAGRTYEEAFLGGLLELSERDSIMLTWLLKLTPDIIQNSSLPSNIYNRIGELEQISGGILYLFDISYDKNFYHIMGILKYKDNGEIKIHIGASAGFDISKVILKSIDEISVNLYYGGDDIKKISSYDDIISVSDHRMFYCQNKNIKYLYFLFQKNKKITYQELEKKHPPFISIGSFLQEMNGDFYLSNLTTTYSQGLGIYVIRILSEDLIPIWFGNYQSIPDNKARLKDPFFNQWKKHSYKYDIPDFLHFFD